MNKKNHKLELYETDQYVDDKLRLQNIPVIADPIIIANDGEVDEKKAFVVDCDGDWSGVNGFEVDDYEKELDEFTSTIEKNIKKLYTDRINELIDAELLSITDIYEKPLTKQEIEEKVIWVSKEYYDFKNNTLVQNRYTNETMPIVNWLCNNPVSASFRVLICELCNIHFWEGESK